MPETIKNLKMGKRRSLFQMCWTKPYKAIINARGYVLLLDAVTFQTSIQPRGEKSSMPSPKETQAGVTAWALKILDAFAAHPIPEVRKSTFPVWYGTQGYSGYGSAAWEEGIFLLIAYDFDALYGKRLEESDDNDDDDFYVYDPIYDIGKTIPGFVSYEGAGLREFEAPTLLGIYDKGRWHPVGQYFEFIEDLYEGI